MAINIRQKGGNGEREIALLLNGILVITLREMGAPQDIINKAGKSVQRNQNQSAVGGGDLINTFGLCIEVKRQEELKLPAWWKQCQASAKRNHELPVLLYRQNNKMWHCRTIINMELPDGSDFSAVADVSYSFFQGWYKMWIRKKLESGETVKT